MVGETELECVVFGSLSETGGRGEEKRASGRGWLTGCVRGGSGCNKVMPQEATTLASQSAGQTGMYG